MLGQRAWVLAVAFASTIWGSAQGETLLDEPLGMDPPREKIRRETLQDMDDTLDMATQDMFAEQADGTYHDALIAEEIEGEEQEEDEQESLSAEQMHGMHKKMDENGDGKVSMAEAMAFSDRTRRHIAEREVESVLEEMDLDGDGKLSAQELAKDLDAWGGEDVKEEHEAVLMKEVETAKFSAADTNKDGLLDIHELPAMFYPDMNEGVLDITTRQMLRQLDKDSDGLLSLEEFWHGGVLENDTLDQEDGDTVITDEGMKEEFRKLDADHSGKLDVQELEAFQSGKFQTQEAMRLLFKLADKDKDMHVTADELGAARARIAGSDAHYPLVEWAEHYDDDL